MWTRIIVTARMSSGGAGEMIVCGECEVVEDEVRRE